MACHAASDQRFRGRASQREHAWDEWQKAVAAFDAALDAAYPKGFWEAFRLLRQGHMADIEPLLLFLEADSHFYRSGYVKADVAQLLKRAPLTENQKARLRRVALNVVDSGDRRELRHFCRLARAVDAPELRAALHERLTHPDPNVRRRAGWMLAACEQRNERKNDRES